MTNFSFLCASEHLESSSAPRTGHESSSYFVAEAASPDACVFFRFGTPIAAAELEKDCGVRNRHFRLDDEHAENLETWSSLAMISSCGKLISRWSLKLCESSCLRYAVTPGESFSAHKGQFPVEINVGAHMRLALQWRRAPCAPLQLPGAGDDGLNAGFGLRGIRGVRNHNPVAVPERAAAGCAVRVPNRVSSVSAHRPCHSSLLSSIPSNFSSSSAHTATFAAFA
jgi:hypothetical protein